MKVTTDQEWKAIVNCVDTDEGTMFSIWTTVLRELCIEDKTISSPKILAAYGTILSQKLILFHEMYDVLAFMDERWVLTGIITKNNINLKVLLLINEDNCVTYDGQRWRLWINRYPDFHAYGNQNHTRWLFGDYWSILF